MGHLELPQPFESYVSIEEILTTEGRQFLLRLRFQIEDSEETRELTWPCMHDIDQRRRTTTGGIKQFKEYGHPEIDAFRQHVEYELAVHGACAYAANGSNVLVWAKARSPQAA